MVSGPAIEVPVPKVLGGPVDDALVQEYLDRYIQAVKTLYDTHKAALGMGDRKLEVH